MTGQERVVVVGVGMSPTSYDDVCARTAEWIAARRGVSRESTPPPARYVCVNTVNGIVVARSDAGFRRILNEADMVTPDGMPLVWAMRSLGRRGQQRVYGPTLMLRLCEQAAKEGHRIFLYGGRPDTLEVLQEKLTARFPRLRIAGAHAPPFRPLTAREDAEVVQMITGCEADIVFVGIGAPKQERWMHAHKESLPGVVMFGVGAAFNFHAGSVRQAPPWMQRCGLEWCYRLLMEPRRLWRRYLIENPVFLPLWLLQLAGLLRTPRFPESEATNV